MQACRWQKRQIDGRVVRIQTTPGLSKGIVEHYIEIGNQVESNEDDGSDDIEAIL